MGNKNPVSYIMPGLTLADPTGNADRLATDAINDTGKYLEHLGQQPGNALGDLTGANQLKQQMRDAEDNRAATQNRLLWERDDLLARNKETDLQSEARKKMKALATSGRGGTILTGFEQAGSAGDKLGVANGKTILG